MTRCLSAHELDGERASFLICTLPVGVRVMCQDGLGVGAVPSECGICRYACRVLDFDYCLGTRIRCADVTPVGARVTCESSRLPFRVVRGCRADDLWMMYPCYPLEFLGYS